MADDITTFSLTREIDHDNYIGDGAVISKTTRRSTAYSLLDGEFRHFLIRLWGLNISATAVASLVGMGLCCLVLHVILFPPPAAVSFFRTTSPNPEDNMQQLDDHHDGQEDKIMLQRHEISEDPELIKVLQSAKMTTMVVGEGTMPPSEMVIVTTVNEAWAKPGSILDLFLESFWNGNGTQELVRHLVIVGLDQKAYQYCQAVHPHCYALTTPGVNFTGTAASYMTDEYLHIVWRAVEFYTSVLSLGFDFVFTDADIVWLRNPFPHFHEQVDFQVGCDFFFGNDSDLHNAINTGFSFVRSNVRTRWFYEFWYESRNRFPGMHDQEVLNKIKFDPFIDEIGLRVKLLDTKLFGGICQAIEDLNVGCTMHATCCIGLEIKIRALAAILQDWKHFSSLPPESRSNSSTSFAWKPERTGCWSV